MTEKQALLAYRISQAEETLADAKKTAGDLILQPFSFEYSLFSLPFQGKDWGVGAVRVNTGN